MSSSNHSLIKKISLSFVITFILLMPQISHAQAADEPFAISDMAAPRKTDLPRDEVLKLVGNDGLKCTSRWEEMKVPRAGGTRGYKVLTLTYPRDYWRVVAPGLGTRANTGGFSITEHEWLFCPTSVAWDRDLLPAVEAGLTGTMYWIVWYLSLAISLIGNLGFFVLKLASNALGSFLGLRGYIDHPYVVTGWPFIQGIANLGFILALLFIAAATTLQLDTFNVRRTLPRLIVAALLINFSLLIGVLFIDASRILMAIIINILGIDSFSQIGLKILTGSGALNGLVDKGGWLSTEGLSVTMSLPFNMAKATLLIWVLSIGMIYVAVGLLARHIALILLLIVSPLAYLAMALPNTKTYAEKWWSNFLKWVFYGPIVLFVLVLLAGIGTGFQHFPNRSSGFNSMIQLLITAAMLFVAAQAGKSLGGYGASMAMGFTSKATNKVGRTTKKAGLFAGGKALKYTPKILDKATGNTVSNAYKSTKDLFGVYRGAKVKADKKQEEARKANSLGTRFGEQLFDNKTYAQKESAKGASKVHAVGGYAGAALTVSPKLSAVNLAGANFASGLSAGLLEDLTIRALPAQKDGLAAGIATMKGLEEPKITAVIDGTRASGDVTILKSMVSNQEIIKDMDDNQRAAILELARSLGEPDVAKDLFASMRRAEQKKEQEKKSNESKK